MTRIENDKIDFEETTERSTPSGGEASVYVKQDKQVYKKSDDGEEIRLSIIDYNDLENRSHGNEDHDIDFAESNHGNEEHSTSFAESNHGNEEHSEDFVKSTTDGEYDIQKNGTDGQGIINFKT